MPPAAKVRAKAASRDEARRGSEGEARRAEQSKVLQSTLLATILQEQLNSLPPEKIKILSKVVKALLTDNKTMRTGSLCSGCDIAFFSTAVVVDHAVKGARVENLFSCEADLMKQGFLHSHVHTQPVAACVEGGSCVFKNITHMGKEKSSCSAHKAQCAIPTGVDGPVILSAGFSCKTLSPLSVMSKSEVPDAIKNRTGSTGTTLQGVADYCESHRVPLLILENVVEILNPKTTNWSCLEQIMDSLGYSIHGMPVQAFKHGSPVPRERAYIIGVHRRRCGLDREKAKEILAAAAGLIEATEFEAPVSFDRLLLDPTHPVVTQELVNMKEASHEPTNKDVKWPDQHLKHLSDAGIPYSAIVVPQAVRDSPWFEVLPHRSRQALGLKLSRGPAARAVDLSQTLTRTPAASAVRQGPDYPCGTLIPRSLMWLPAEGRVLTGYEHLRLMCYPVELLPKLTEVSRFLQVDLAGNMFNGASFQLVLVCFLASLPANMKIDWSLATDGPSDEELATDIADSVAALYSEAPDDGDIDL